MNTSRYDALVIGGGPAGSTAALVMARAGLRVAASVEPAGGGQPEPVTSLG